MIGIGTFEFITENEHANAAFYYYDLVFLSIFSVELSLAIFHLRYDALTDIWSMVDFLIIIMSWISVDSLGEVTNDFQVIRSFRIFRILSRIEALKDVLAAIGHCLPRLGCFVLFSYIIIFIFAILFTEQYRDMYTHGQTDFD